MNKELIEQVEDLLIANNGLIKEGTAIPYAISVELITLIRNATLDSLKDKAMRQKGETRRICIQIIESER